MAQVPPLGCLDDRTAQCGHEDGDGLGVLVGVRVASVPM